MAETEQQRQVGKELNIPMILVGLHQLLGDQTLTFQTMLKIWDTDQKFEILSYTDNTDGGFLNAVLSSICDPERANIPGNDPDLIDHVLSGLTGEQRLHLLNLRDFYENSPFNILASQKGLTEEVYLKILKKLFTGLTPEQKFEALETDQKRWLGGVLLNKMLETASIALLDVIRGGLSPLLFSKWLVTPNASNRYPLMQIIDKGNLQFLEACLDGIRGKERLDLISATPGGTTSAITWAVQASAINMTQALLEGLENIEDESEKKEAYHDAYYLPNDTPLSPYSILKRRAESILEITEFFNASAQGLSGQPELARDNTLVTTDPQNIQDFEDKVSGLCLAISGRTGNAMDIINDLPDDGLWAILGGRYKYSTRPIDKAISHGDLFLLNIIAQRTPVWVMKSLLMDKEGHPCLSLITLIKSSNTNRIGRLKILLKNFNEEERQEIFNAKDENGNSIQSLMKEEELELGRLASCFPEMSQHPNPYNQGLTPT